MILLDQTMSKQKHHFDCATQIRTFKLSNLRSMVIHHNCREVRPQVGRRVGNIINPTPIAYTIRDEELKQYMLNNYPIKV